MYLEVTGKKHEHLRSKYVVGLQAVIKPRLATATFRWLLRVYVRYEPLHECSCACERG